MTFFLILTLSLFRISATGSNVMILDEKCFDPNLSPIYSPSLVALESLSGTFQLLNVSPQGCNLILYLVGNIGEAPIDIIEKSSNVICFINEKNNLGCSIPSTSSITFQALGMVSTFCFSQSSTLGPYLTVRTPNSYETCSV